MVCENNSDYITASYLSLNGKVTDWQLGSKPNAYYLLYCSRLDGGLAVCANPCFTCYTFSSVFSLLCMWDGESRKRKVMRIFFLSMLTYIINTLSTTSQ